MNLEDPTADEMPVRDVPVPRAPTKNISEAKERQLVAALSRQDLEDRYLRLREEHVELKKLTRTQEEKMKQMATKLLRLFKDKKKIDGQDGVSRRDAETAEFIEDLQAQIRELTKTNEALKNKLTVTKQQLQTQGKKQTPYDNVKPRVQTGIMQARSPSRQQRIKEQMRVQGQMEQKLSSRTPQPLLPQPRYGHSLLEETRIEKRELEDLVASLNEQIRSIEDEREKLKEKSRIKQLEHEEEKINFESKISEMKKASMQENVELIRLEREIKEKSNKLEIMQSKFHNVQQMLEKLKMSNEKALDEMEILTLKLKEEQARNSTLQNEIRHADFLKKTLSEKDETIADLKAENDVLKDAQERILQSTFDAERERRFRQKEREYQVKISQLEAVSKADVLEKNELLDKLSREKDENEKVQNELKEVRVNYYSQKELYEDLADKMKFFSKESNIDFDEMQEALMLIKTRKEKQSQELSFLGQVEEEMSQDLRKQLLELQTSHAETINELDKTRNMLKMQSQINKDYQTEVGTATRKMDDLKRDCDARVKEYAEMLDIRAERIKKLEAQLKDIAYGTKQYKIEPTELHELESAQDEAVVDVNYELERGQNVLEIHIGKVLVTKQGLAVFGNAEPVTFVTWEFFEFEMQATPVISGQRPVFGFTAQYIVNVDDFFLHYIQKECICIEFHQAVGTEYKTIATGKLRMNGLLDKSHGRVYGTAKLLGIDSNEELAVLEYWIRLRVPMEQALRLFKERSKALGYITSNSTSNVNEERSSTLESGINELKISVHRCTKLQPKTKKQPSSYAVYKFFDFADHDTEIIVGSSTPEFNDVQVFPVSMSEELDNYLKTTELEIYVFDDNEIETTTYMGLAKVPLVTLSQDKLVKGTFPLLQPNGERRGTIDVTLQWLSTYLPASSKARSYPKLMSAQNSPKNSKPPSGPLRGSMRPFKQASNQFHDPEDIKVPEKNVASKEKDSPKTHPLHDAELAPHPRQRTVSFNEDTMVNSFDGSKAPIEEPTVEWEVLKSIPVEEMTIDEMIEKVEEKGDIVEDSGNNYESDEALMEEELRRTVEAPDVPASPTLNKDIGNDTLFEESISDDVSLEDDDVVFVPGASRGANENNEEDPGTSSQENAQEGINSAETSDSEGVVVSSAPSKALSASSKRKMVVTIEVGSLMLYDNAAVYSMDNQMQLYVAYRFLDEDPASLETPDSLPLPKPNRPIHYNFKKVFYVDNETHEYQHQQLMSMLMPEHPLEGKLYFSVVTEPVDGDICEDAGIACVDFIQILREGRDLVDEDIEVLDLQGELIGTLTVTVEALDALQSLYE
ncbi:protein fantom-like [Rhopilema esculentum]|uniref:protein fantom-like n=1 Tax=Rhopilema esculentum TaxID=499914 RepID=UPI0031D30002